MTRSIGEILTTGLSQIIPGTRELAVTSPNIVRSFMSEFQQRFRKLRESEKLNSDVGRAVGSMITESGETTLEQLAKAVNFPLFGMQFEAMRTYVHLRTEGYSEQVSYERATKSFQELSDAILTGQLEEHRYGKSLKAYLAEND